LQASLPNAPDGDAFIRRGAEALLDDGELWKTVDPEG
jgi:hypothetical protein